MNISDMERSLLPALMCTANRTQTNQQRVLWRIMKKTSKIAANIVLCCALPMLVTTNVQADGHTIGVSWADFETSTRWRIDEAAMLEAIDAAGNSYVSRDAAGSPEKQLNDINAMVDEGADAIIVLATDVEAISSAIDYALDADVSVIAYDRLIEREEVFYITFDNVEVGRMQAAAVFEAQPEGNYAFIKGSPTDANAELLFVGQMEVLEDAIASGDIVNVGVESAIGWSPDDAQQKMEKMLDDNNNNIDAVVAANDGTAGGVIAALAQQQMDGDVPVSGQDGEAIALNRVARGLQTVSVWKDARVLGGTAAELASLLADGVDVEMVPGSDYWSDGPNGTEMNVILLDPEPITIDELDIVLDAGWIEKEVLCEGAIPAATACGGSTVSSLDDD